MSRKTLVLLPSLFLVGCGMTQTYETVSVRIDGISCSENVKVDDSTAAVVDYESKDGRFDLSLRGSVPDIKPEHGFNKRCQDILDAASIIAKNKAERSELDREMHEKEHEIEIEQITGGDSLFDSDF